MPQWNWKELIPLKGRWRKREEAKQDKKGKEHERQITDQEHGTKHLNNTYLPCNVTENVFGPCGMSSQPEYRASYSPGGALLPGPSNQVDIVVPQLSSQAQRASYSPGGALLPGPSNQVDIVVPQLSPHAGQIVYYGSDLHQNPSQLNPIAGPINSTPYDESFVHSPPASNSYLASGACAALDPVPPSIPFVHPESNVKPTFAAYEQLNSPSVPRVSCGCRNHHQVGQGEIENKHDSACHFSNRDSAIGNNLESQDNGGQLPNEGCIEFPAYDEVAARTRLGFGGETLKDEVRDVEKGSRGLSENGLRQSTARGGIETLSESKNVKQDLRPSEPNLVPETSNANAQEDVEGPKNSEVPIIEQSSAIVSQPCNQVELSSSWRSQAAMTQYSQRDFRESLGLEGLPDHVVQQLEHNHKQNVRFVQQACEARVSENLKQKRSVGTFDQSGESMESVHDVERQRSGYHRQPMHHTSRSSLKFENQNIGPGRPGSPFPFRGGIQHDMSTQNQSSPKVHPVGSSVSVETQYNQSSVLGTNDVNSKRKHENPVEARYNTRVNYVAGRAHTYNPNHHLRIPSASSGHNFVPGPYPTNPSLHYLRNRGGPIDPRPDSHASRSIVAGPSSPEEPFPRSFPGYLENSVPQRPCSMYPTTRPDLRNLTEHMSEVEYGQDISSQWSVPVTPSNSPNRLPPWTQSPQDCPMPRPLRRNSVKGAYRPSMLPASTNVSMPLNHRRSMGVFPPSGPLITDIRPLNLPKRGTRSPTYGPMLPSTPTASTPTDPNTTNDKRNERTSPFYSPNNPENSSAPKRAIGEENREMPRRGLNLKSPRSTGVMEKIQHFEKAEAKRPDRDLPMNEAAKNGKEKVSEQSTTTILSSQISTQPTPTPASSPARSPEQQDSTAEEISSTSTPPHPEQPTPVPPSPAPEDDAYWDEMRRYWGSKKINAQQMKHGVVLEEDDEEDEGVTMSGALSEGRGNGPLEAEGEGA
jgi:hypothetical protein